MARSSAKRTVIRNRALLRNLAIGEVATLLVFVFLSSVRSTGPWTMLLKTVPEALGVFFLFRVSRPKYAFQNNARRLVDGGTSLDTRGTVSLCFDFVYLSWAVRTLSVFTGWAYLLYLVLPVSVVYEFFPGVLGIRKGHRPR